ncbi:MAG: AI-2E family transporter [Acidimicrobiia bacterium]
MPETVDLTADAQGDVHAAPSADGDFADAVPGLLARVPRLGVWAWSFVGFVVASIIVFIALAAVSEIVLPMTFAAVLAIIFRPFVGVLVRHKFKPSLAAGLIVLGLIALMVGVVVATVHGVTDQVDEISASADDAINELAGDTDALGVEEGQLDAARAAIDDAVPMITTGVLSGLVSGLGTLVAIASGVILGSLIMYYLLKDGTKIRRSVVKSLDPRFRDGVDDFIGDACRILRDYGSGRTIMSAIVALVVGVAALLLGMPLVFTIVVVNFIGGYIPYVGAFLGGGLAVIVAIGDGGLTEGLIMLAVVLAANLALENFVEPKVMGRSLDMHPLVVLVVTALGGLLGGIVGLILAVPAWAIGSVAIKRLRERGVIDRVAARAQPAVEKLLS